MVLVTGASFGISRATQSPYPILMADRVKTVTEVAADIAWEVGEPMGVVGRREASSPH